MAVEQAPLLCLLVSIARRSVPDRDKGFRRDLCGVRKAVLLPAAQCGVYARGNGASLRGVLWRDAERRRTRMAVYGRAL